MIDILNLPVYYISFKKNLSLEKELKKQGFNNVNHFKAVDGRKYVLGELVKKEILTPRAYNDLRYGREQHSGITSLGAIGCTLSHLELWKYCIAQNFPFIVVAEEDAYFKKQINPTDLKKITTTLQKNNSCFISTNKNLEKNEQFFGTQFYIVSKDGAKQLVKKCLPIDLQTDAYMAHLNDIGDITLEGYDIVGQKSHKSTIQDICIKCFLPQGSYFYITVVLGIIVLIVLIIFIYKKYSTTKFQLDSMRSSYRSD